MEYDAIAIHFGEIWLKGRNRAWFVKSLYRNVADALKGEKYEKLVDERDRFMLYLKKGSEIESIEERLRHVFGLSWFAPVVFSKNSLKDIVDTSCRALKGRKDPIKIVPSRSYKGVAFNSDDIVREFFKKRDKLGFVLDRDAEEKLFINVRQHDAIICIGRIRGLGGLPVGTSGRAVVLLSGGIDSPVASFYAMKKGLMPLYIHIHGFSDNKEAEKSKIKDIVNVLSGYSGRARVYYMPIHMFQAAVMRTPKSQELVLFKHFIYRLAETIAKKEDAIAIVTGESLGQVASQTAQNLTATQQGIKTLVVRPLISFDKDEIIGAARKLGTYDISILPYLDVCAIRAKHPSTGAEGAAIRKLYKECKLDGVLKETIKKSSVVDFSR